MSTNFRHLTDTQLIQAYSNLLKELKARNIIKSNNLVGDLAETHVINYYKVTTGLPTLSLAPAGCVDFDAVGKNGKRYSIKGTSGQVTGSFFGMPSPTEPQPDFPKFDFVIIVKFGSEYELEKIIEITWEQFFDFRKWLPRQHAYNLPISRRLMDSAKIVYPAVV